MKNSDETQEEYLEGLFSHLRSRIRYFEEYDYSIPGLKAGLEACLLNPQRENLAREFAYLLQFAYTVTGKTSEAIAVRALLPASKDTFIEVTTEAISMSARNEIDNAVLCALLKQADDRNSVLSAIKVFSQMAFFFDHRNAVVPKTCYLAEVSLCQVFPNRKSKLDWEVPRIKLQKIGSTKVKMLSETDRNKCEIEKIVRSSWADEGTQLGEVSIQIRKTNDEFVSAKPATASSCLSQLLARLNVCRGDFEEVDSGELKLMDDKFNIHPNKETILHVEEFVNDACKSNKLSENMHRFQNGEIIEIHLYDNLIYDPLYYPNRRLADSD